MIIDKIDWTEPMTCGSVVAACRALGIDFAHLALYAGIPRRSAKMIFDTEADARIRSAPTFHKIRVFLFEAGIDFKDGRPVVMHEWSRPLTPPGPVFVTKHKKGAKRTGRKPLTDEQKRESHERFLLLNADIISRYDAGDPLLDIAADERVSKQRIHQIIKKAGLPLRTKRP